MNSKPKLTLTVTLASAVLGLICVVFLSSCAKRGLQGTTPRPGYGMTKPPPVLAPTPAPGAWEAGVPSLSPNSEPPSGEVVVLGWKPSPSPNSEPSLAALTGDPIVRHEEVWFITRARISEPSDDLPGSGTMVTKR